MPSRSSQRPDRTPRYNVSVEAGEPFAGAPGLVRLAARVLAGEGVPAGATVSILLTGDDEMRRLNREFRGRDEATDVLSFGGPSEGFVEGKVDGSALGDIAIGVTAAGREAAQRGVSLGAEVEHLLVHALLHLCGHDHESGPGSEAELFRREEAYLGDLSAFHGPDREPGGGTSVL